ncbi:hypothetical protein, partial [Acinetobacter baumannii]|uniref:hypothetical protein n=1 Tax=Acinetobacter baumannii TaxID=470 RepID=UPI00165F39D8
KFESDAEYIFGNQILGKKIFSSYNAERLIFQVKDLEQNSDNFNDAGDLVYGHAEPFSEILVKDGQGNILNKWFWNNWTDESG